MNGMKNFYVVWVGQAMSTIGSQVLGFALSVWLYERTGSLIQFGLMVAMQVAPTVLLSPFAGMLVDRFNRRMLMLASDTIEVLNTGALLLLLATGHLEVWHVYVSTLISAILGTMHQLAYGTTISLLVPKEGYGRANGLVQMAQSTGTILAPLIAVGMMQWSGLQTILMLDVLSFVFAVITLLLVRIPDVPRRQASAAGRSWKQEMLFGWQYVRARPELNALMRFMALCCFAVGFVQVLFRPLILTVSSVEYLGMFVTIAGVGGLLGSMYVAATGGPRNKVRGVIISMGVLGASVMLHGAMMSPMALGVAAFSFAFCFPLVGVGVQSFWQQAVPAEVQGRVFAFRRVVTSSSVPIGVLLSPWLTEYVVAPLIAPGGTVERVAGFAPGRYPGADMAILLFLMGFAIIVAAAIAMRNQHLGASARAETEQVPGAV